MVQHTPIHPILEAWFYENLPISRDTYATLPAYERQFHDILVDLQMSDAASDVLSKCEQLADTARLTGEKQLVVGSLFKWAIVSSYYKRTEENAHLINRIKTILDDTFPVEIQSFFLFVQYVCARRLGLPHPNTHIRRLLKKSEVGSAMWQTGAFRSLAEAAERGCLSDRASLRGRFESCHSRVRFPLYPAMPFVNAVQIGDLSTAIPMLSKVRGIYKAHGSLSVFGVQRVLVELQLRHLPGAWDAPYRPYAEEAAECFQEEGIRLDSFLMTTRHLLKGQVQEALDAARSYAANLGAPFFALPRFDGYDMVRAELAAGHIDGATFMLRKRFENGAYGWLDNFFLARVAHLKGKTRTAENAYHRTRTMANHYGAENRLLFELLLACELPTATLARWTAMLTQEITEPPPLCT